MKAFVTALLTVAAFYFVTNMALAETCYDGRETITQE